MNNRFTFFVQIIGDLAIPLLGYFFWDWSLFFILLFYLIENLFFSFFRIETIREIKKVVLKKDQKRDIKTLVKSLILWFLEFILLHSFVLVIYPNKNLLNEWINFFMYQDLGIPQGIILLPLLYYTSRLKMKQDTFLFIRSIESPIELSGLTVNFFTSWLAIGFWGFLIGINYFFQINELINLTLVLLLVVFKSIKKS